MLIEGVGNLEVATVSRDLDFKYYILPSLVSSLLVIVGRFLIVP
ncbi:hypothetical protein GQ41_1957 [Arenibacter algicola]|uniref:Uncharacterized protein n=1 Tax=Arenibacter algicola TaxID=616991 RepID=A0ABY3A9D9_9FLAO|tara:strand:- start:4397 stop:4528 length:132 start_codon:yes stop_codon:yes gene_type:complete